MFNLDLRILRIIWLRSYPHTACFVTGIFRMSNALVFPGANFCRIYAFPLFFTLISFFVCFFASLLVGSFATLHLVPTRVYIPRERMDPPALHAPSARVIIGLFLHQPPLLCAPIPISFRATCMGPTTGADSVNGRRYGAIPRDPSPGE